MVIKVNDKFLPLFFRNAQEPLDDFSGGPLQVKKPLPESQLGMVIMLILVLR